MEQVLTAGSGASATASLPPQPLRFTGTGSEYFGIWIVNLLLTIVTLGIYSAWAKVRRLKYFYRHTELAGSNFDFHGSAVRIFIGRVLAVGMLVLYNLSIRLHSALTLVVILALALILPWLLRNSLRFRLYNSSWRGTRFHFRGTVARAYRIFLLNYFLALITLYGLLPFAHQRLKAYQHGNTWFGQTQCSFHARVGQYYLLYVALLGAFVVLGIIASLSGVGAPFAHFVQARHGSRVDPATMLKLLVGIYAVVILIAVLVGPAFRALITNLTWNNTRIGAHRIACNLSPWGFIWIVVSNFLLIVVTLGLFIPWAMVRVARFQIEAMQLLPASDLQEFVTGTSEDVGALGVEAASVFDFDISL